MSGEQASGRGARLAEQARAGDRLALARLLTEIENGGPVAAEAIANLYPHAGGAHLLGITGPPGSGKSTLVAALVGEVRADGRTVAVLAVDPSSPITGGALLGDRVRMQRHAGDEGVFIRSMAARAHAGGLAASTIAAATALAACGFDLVIVETVGAGQAEVEVAAVADTTIVVEAPGMGDEVQAIKAGLLEVADIVVVGKADRPGAEAAAANLRAMLTVGAQHDLAAAGRPRPKRPLVLLASGLTGAGVRELLEAIDRRYAQASADGAGRDPVRLARASAQVRAILAERLWQRLSSAAHRATTEAALAAVAAHDLDPSAAAERLLDELATDP